MSVAWRRRDPAEWTLTDCGDGVVIYHRPSGKTHLMNDASVLLLTNVLSTARSLDEIIDAFDPDPELVDLTEFGEQMAGLLERLEHFGFVDRLDAE